MISRDAKLIAIARGFLPARRSDTLEAKLERIARSVARDDDHLRATIGLSSSKCEVGNA
jgi:hypothetical protein